MDAPPTSWQADMRPSKAPMNAAVEFFREAIEPGVSRMAGGRVQIVHKDVIRDWWRVFERARAWTKLPFLSLDVFFSRKGERSFQIANQTVINAELMKFISPSSLIMSFEEYLHEIHLVWLEQMKIMAS